MISSDILLYILQFHTINLNSDFEVLFCTKTAVADINYWYYILWATILLKIKLIPTLNIMKKLLYVC